MNVLQKLKAFFSPRKAIPTFEDVCERTKKPEFFIALFEAGLLSGEIQISLFWKNSSGCFFEKANKLASDNEIQPEPHLEMNASDFERLRAEIIQLDEPKLKGYASSIKDGVAYTIYWGNEDQRREISARNPESGTRHAKLVSRINEAIAKL
jgi:hypothetical protein